MTNITKVTIIGSLALAVLVGTIYNTSYAGYAGNREVTAAQSHAKALEAANNGNNFQPSSPNMHVPPNSNITDISNLPPGAIVITGTAEEWARNSGLPTATHAKKQGKDIVLY